MSLSADQPLPSNSTTREGGTVGASAEAAPIHESIGEFEILGKLGEGAFGQVFLARQSSLGREVALKVTRRKEGDAERPSGIAERNEGQLLAGLEHDHIVKVFSAFTDKASGARGLCLQYVPGADLGAVIRHIHDDGKPPESGRAILAALDANRRGIVGFDPAALRDRDALAGDDFPQAVCRIGARLAEALAFAHARGILHCDIKPANILMTPYGRPMLADFNVAFDRTRHRGLGIGGTIAYMAPEHRAAVSPSSGAAVTVDERCDVYSLGMVLHEFATGNRPGKAKVYDLADADKDPLEGVPRELAAVIRRCLEMDPALRYQTAGELATALDAARQLLAARRALPTPGRIGKWVTAHPIEALAAAGLVAHLIASGVNIAYNAVRQTFTDDQWYVFVRLIGVYDPIAYLICYGTACVLIWRIRRGWNTLPQAAGPDVDALRRRVVAFGWWSLVLGSLGWLPACVTFPLILDLLAGQVLLETYIHFAVSFILGGLIGIVYTYLAIEYVTFRALLPRLGNPDTFTSAKFWGEVRSLTTLFGPFVLLACGVPLAGAVMLVVSMEGEMTLGFRLLVAGLIGLGVVGVGIAERLTRALRALAAVWQRE